MQFISYYPLKQGLKQNGATYEEWGTVGIYILLSIKTRIETKMEIEKVGEQDNLYPTIH